MRTLCALCCQQLFYKRKKTKKKRKGRSVIQLTKRREGEIHDRLCSACERARAVEFLAKAHCACGSKKRKLKGRVVLPQRSAFVCVCVLLDPQLPKKWIALLFIERLFSPCIVACVGCCCTFSFLANKNRSHLCLRMNGQKHF